MLDAFELLSHILFIHLFVFDHSALLFQPLEEKSLFAELALSPIIGFFLTSVLLIFLSSVSFLLIDKVQLVFQFLILQNFEENEVIEVVIPS